MLPFGQPEKPAAVLAIGMVMVLPIVQAVVDNQDRFAGPQKNKVYHQNVHHAEVAGHNLHFQFSYHLHLLHHHLLPLENNLYVMYVQIAVGTMAGRIPGDLLARTLLF
uniref:Putative secreted protein n=1 Tax=Panstrongylus lignarius TaxID=156445 RepID=A0A224Y234_9HEMI